MSFFQDIEATLLTGPADDSEVQNTVDQEFDNVMEEQKQQLRRSEEEVRTLSEVESRLFKANLYRAVLENPLFPDEQSQTAYEVEQEFREFTLSRLNALLGVSNNKQPEAVLDPEEVNVLKIWAKKLLNKPTALNIQAAPVEVKPPPVVTPVVVSRPASTPRMQTASVSPKRIAQPVQQAKSAKKPVVVKDVQPEDDVEFVYKGGRKYLKQAGRDAITGKPKDVLVDVTKSVNPVGITPAPYPHPQVAMMTEANNAALFQPNSGPLGQALQKITTRTSDG